jgi:hypothetical protein
MASWVFSRNAWVMYAVQAAALLDYPKASIGQTTRGLFREQV